MTTGYDLVGDLTKRELFAAVAMQGLLSYPKRLSAAEKTIAMLAVSHAAALIEALNAPDQPKEQVPPPEPREPCAACIAEGGICSGCMPF